MLAQTTDAVLPNGTGSSEAPVVQGPEGAVNSSHQLQAGDQVGDAQQQTRDTMPGGAQCGELGHERGNTPLDPGAATTAVQAERQATASTTVTVGRLLEPENSGLPRSIEEQPTGQRTPVVSTGPRSTFQPSWLGNMEVPRGLQSWAVFLILGQVRCSLTWHRVLSLGCRRFLRPQEGPHSAYALQADRELSLRRRLHRPLQVYLQKQYRQKCKDSWAECYSSYRSLVFKMSFYSRS